MIKNFIFLFNIFNKQFELIMDSIIVFIVMVCFIKQNIKFAKIAKRPLALAICLDLNSWSLECE